MSARQSKHPVVSRWIVYDNEEHDFSVYYNEQEARKEYEARIKIINDAVGTDEYSGDEEVYLCQVISKAEVVWVGRDDQSDEALHRLMAYDCPATDVLDFINAKWVREYCNVEIASNTRRWERDGRHKNDAYTNGSHSGYVHALQDLQNLLDRIERVESRRQRGGI